MRGLIALNIFLFGGQLGLAAEQSSEPTSSVTTANQMKVGAELRSEAIWSDEGFSDTESYEVPPTTKIALTNARLMLSGQMNQQIQYSLKFDFLNTKETPLQYGYVSYTTDGIAFYVGKMKVHQGGWDQRMNGVGDHVQGNYKKHLVFSSYEPMVAAALSAKGKITLQLVNDVTTDTKGQWNQSKHLTPIISWFGELGSVDPVLAFGSYDNNKSYWLDIGLAAEFGAFKGRVDTKLDSYSNKVREAGEIKDYADKTTSVSIKLEYKVPDLVRPWLYVSTFDRAQYESSVANKKDDEVNASSISASGTFIYALNDNATTVGTGVDLLSLGKQWTPFVAWTSTFATFAKQTDPAASEKKTQSTLHLGCFAEI